MAFTFKSKRQGYDNISAGNAAGKELIVVAGGDGEGETTRRSLSQRGTSTSVLSQEANERLINDGTTVDVRTGQASSDSLPLINQTSGTSDTSAFAERLGA
jgi:hypothetical protein